MFWTTVLDHCSGPVFRPVGDMTDCCPLVFLTERSDARTRARPAVLRQGSMLLSASDSKVEDLAFDNLRLARRATALEDQLHRATNPSHSSLWGLFCTTASEPASSEAPGAAANEELAAKAHENEQLHIAIYEQLRERTHKQRIEAARARGKLLRAEVALLEGAAEKREALLPPPQPPPNETRAVLRAEAAAAMPRSAALLCNAGERAHHHGLTYGRSV